MKKLFQLVLTISLFTSCGNNKADQPIKDEDTQVLGSPLFWQATLNDSTGKLEMTKIEADIDFKDNDAIISSVNRQYPNVQFRFLRISNDTIYVNIPDATYLTQQMGSTGPTMYFAYIVYNLTEFFPGIKYVNFDFEEGDHASPDVLSRESFKDQ